MDVAEICNCIGAKRFVWIDDDFNDTPERLGKLLFENHETTRQIGDTAINEILEALEADSDSARHDLLQHLTQLEPDERVQLKRRFFKARGGGAQAEPELGESLVETVCGLLAIQNADRHPFDEATGAIERLSQEDVCYIVDLKDVGSNGRRGLEVLRHLGEVKAKGLAFILTHETTRGEEAKAEEALGHDLAAEGGSADVPICVIAKDRLFGAADVEEIKEELKIALKRAGLRKSMHDVLRIAKEHVGQKFDDAARKLLLIPPETLDAFAIERAYKEGLSELHVVERALSSHTSRSLRHLFGTDAKIRSHAEMMRRLHDEVALPIDIWLSNPHLEEFLQAEIFENDELINIGLAPLASGDIFETEIVAVKGKPSPTKQRFLLLGQACDVAIRAKEDRDQEAAFLVPVRVAGSNDKDKLKEISLPFAIGGEVWICSLRNATMAKLDVLDLASFRQDGRVRVDLGHELDPGLLAGQRRIYARRTEPANRALAALAKASTAKHSKRVQSQAVLPCPIDLQLTLAHKNPFHHIHMGIVVSANDTTAAHVSWRLRRVGRLQTPFAAAMLEALTSVMSRRAFDIDFARPKSTLQPAMPTEAIVAPSQVGASEPENLKDISSSQTTATAPSQTQGSLTEPPSEKTAS